MAMRNPTKKIVSSHELDLEDRSEENMMADGWVRTHRGWRKVYSQGSGPGGTCGDQAWKDRVCRSMSIPPEQATPERIAQENAKAKQHGTGAVYDSKGNCHTPGRHIEAREMRRRHFQNNDAGYADCGGR